MGMFGVLLGGAVTGLLVRGRAPRNVALVLVQDQEGRVLALRRSAQDQWMPGRWGLPGGHINKGESESEAAMRELEEETGLRAIALTPFAARRSKRKSERIYRVSLRHTSGDLSLEKATHGHEHSEYRWISPKTQGLELVPGMKPLLERIWGVSNGHP